MEQRPGKLTHGQAFTTVTSHKTSPREAQPRQAFTTNTHKHETAPRETEPQPTIHNEHTQTSNSAPGKQNPSQAFTTNTHRHETAPRERNLRQAFTTNTHKHENNTHNTKKQKLEWLMKRKQTKRDKKTRIQKPQGEWQTSRR